MDRPGSLRPLPVLTAPLRAASTIGTVLGCFPVQVRLRPGGSAPPRRRTPPPTARAPGGPLIPVWAGLSGWPDMVTPVRLEGEITRGTTNPSRLRRVDRWITQAERPLLSVPRPLLVDLGYGA